MDNLRWEKIQALFHEAADLPESEQRAFLNSACLHDQALLADVMALLHEDSHQRSLLDNDIAEVAHHVLADATPDLLLARELGPYRVKKVLGEGGMGVVYLAEREDLSTLVAIKILRDAWFSPARRERFAAEQRTLAQLNHPSIARLYDADTLTDGTPCFVMEYVDGVPLTEYCRKHRCSVARRLQLFRAVCEAVQYAHQHAVIHRDLKPSNVLVKNDGSLRLLDFGIAKHLDSLDAPVDQTLTGLRLMTPAYAAPEQVRGDRVGIQTDVYSLGVILYELLTEQLPLNLANLTPAEAATVIVSHDPDKPSITAAQAATGPAVSKSAWADLDVLCLTAMHKEPERRYRSVEALIRDVDHYLNREPLEARPDSLSYRLGKFVRRNRRAVLVTASVFLLLVGLVAFFTYRLARARDTALAEAARTQRIQSFMLNLFQGGDEAAGPADDLRVVTLVDRGVQQAQALTAEPGVQAELYETLGTVYQNLGKFDQADQLLQLSLARRRSLFGPDSPEVADSLVALGLLRAAQAKFDEAEQYVRQGLDIRKRKLPPEHPASAKATFALGLVLEDRGAYEQAIQALNNAVQLQSTPGGVEADLSASLTELANCHFYLGHYDTSDELNRRILAMDQKLYGEHHPHIADDLINLGAIQYERGHYAECENYYRRALDITQSFYGKDHPETASALTLLGRSLVAQGKFDEASQTLQAALAIQERAYGKVHPRVASALNDLGKVALKQRRLDEAEADFLRVEAIYRQVYGDKHQYVAVALSNLGSVYTERKDYPRAEKALRQTIALYSEVLSPNHQYTAIARTKLGRVLLRQQRFAEAEVESRAGYDILLKTGAAPAFLDPARDDLVAEYTALHRPEELAKLRPTSQTASASH